MNRPAQATPASIREARNRQSNGSRCFTAATSSSVEHQAARQRSKVQASMGKLAVSGALTLYLDFINLFVLLLQLFGDRRQ